MAMDRSPREMVAERGLTADAIRALTPLMAGVGFDELGLVKALLKRFFSAEPWTAVDAAALSRAVGPAPADLARLQGALDERDGVRGVRRRIARDLSLVAGWVDDRFFIDVEDEGEQDVDRSAAEEQPAGSAGSAASAVGADAPTSRVVAEPTPNPRTMRFATPPRTVEEVRAYHRGGRLDDDRVAAIFAVDPVVVDVLVGASFVAVSLSRPARWAQLLDPLLAAVEAGFAEDDGADMPATPHAAGAGRDHGGPVPAPRPPDGERHRTRLERAWDELGHLRGGDAEHVAEVAAASGDRDAARRQVAAQLLSDAPDAVAAAAWARLLDDPSRAVRRAALDAVVDAEREELRPLLERALGDDDAWMRWKALHGLVVLGVGPSLAVVEPLADDPDVRVRLEVENARRG
jgi:hypothetical protein